MGFQRFERKRILVAALLLALSMEGAMAHSSYRSKIPNGQTTIDGAVGYGHVSKSGGGSRNQFGLDFVGNSRTWSESLCCLDSDGDGKHNGLELGDPCCTWTEGGNPDVASGLSHPGRDDSTTTNTIPDTCKDVCEGKSDSKSGGVDSGATKYAPLLVVGCALVAINFLN